MLIMLISFALVGVVAPIGPAAAAPACQLPFEAPTHPELLSYNLYCSPWRNSPSDDSWLNLRKGYMVFPNTEIVYLEYWNPPKFSLAPVEDPDKERGIYVDYIKIVNTKNGRVTTCEPKTWLPVNEKDFCRFDRLVGHTSKITVEMRYLYRKNHWLTDIWIE
ncbi:hypothetical protein [Micromonospora sp. NPDC051141]|uniref:hypothetical protein n=1 Tax=Micromonospora sp. NPDC051141 TaxID=3364284 RepID=UPI0037AE70BD